jgi:hypothetical protein
MISPPCCLPFASLNTLIKIAGFPDESHDIIPAFFSSLGHAHIGPDLIEISLTSSRPFITTNSHPTLWFC